MKYTMTTPCDQCPFLNNSGFKLAALYRHASGEFACHKTCEVDDVGTFQPKRDRPHQMMRICERLGFYDRTKLDMEAPVQ